MKIKFINIILIISLSILSVGCGSAQPKVSQEDFLQEHVSLQDFYTALESAKKYKVNFFAPDGFKSASKLYEESFKLAKNSEEEKSVLLVQKGQTLLNKSVQNAEDARELFKDVILFRGEALSLGINAKYQSRFDDADKKFMKANSLVEKGDLTDMLKYSNELSIAYNSIRSDILKDLLLDMVSESSNLAQSNNSADSAPKTMALAQTELNTALDIVTKDPTKIAEAKIHANRSIHNYKKANQITSMIKHFKEEKYNEEDYILWYWEQLETINEHLGDELDFTKNNYLITDNINRATAALIKELQNARQSIKKQYELSSAELLAQQQKYDALSDKFNAQVLALQLKKQKQKMNYKSKEEQYTFVNSLFDAKSEAKVYKEKENIVISVFGLEYTANKSEISIKSNALLTKVLSAIKQYPKAKIVLYGHTHSIGEADDNMKLSLQRVNNVAKFLTEIGHIPKSKITTKGYGESKPVATNMIKAGRLLNSRIDVHLILTK